jgi:hypothetical protein
MFWTASTASGDDYHDDPGMGKTTYKLCLKELGPVDIRQKLVPPRVVPLNEIRIMEDISTRTVKKRRTLYVGEHNSRCQPPLRIGRFPLINLSLLGCLELDLELVSQSIYPPLDVFSHIVNIEQEGLESQKVDGVPRVPWFRGEQQHA